ncbi:MAG: hypothetical protein M1834_004430 [Cirrosporium novae-zelandiae]|nr:MAG: hypothetical protein M1834_004430 [Cirrosporium novae-zelandiae]
MAGEDLATSSASSPSTSPSSETLESLQARHRKELRDLQSRITQKKKSTTKKTRKGVNDECTELERQIKEKHAAEIAALNGDAEKNAHDQGAPPEEEDNEPTDPTNSHPDTTTTTTTTTSISETTNQLKKLSVTGNKNSEPQQYHKKPNRQKARLARRAAEQEAQAAQAAEEAANMPDQREIEQAAMAKHFEKLGLKEQDIRPDGHCLYSAVADQLKDNNLELEPKIEAKIMDETQKKAALQYKTVRQVAAGYIDQHPDDFLPFLEEPLADYVRKIKDTAEWGGQLELLALAKAYEVTINVLQNNGKVERIEGGGDVQLWLAYYKHSFGLGEHYNSLRKAP